MFIVGTGPVPGEVCGTQLHSCYAPSMVTMGFLVAAGEPTCGEDSKYYVIGIDTLMRIPAVFQPFNYDIL